MILLLFFLVGEDYKRWNPPLEYEEEKKEKKVMNFIDFEDFIYKYPGAGVDRVYIGNPEKAWNFQLDIKHAQHISTMFNIREKEPSSIEFRHKYGKIGIRYSPKPEENISVAGGIISIYFPKKEEGFELLKGMRFNFCLQLIIDRVLFLEPPEMKAKEQRYAYEISGRFFDTWNEKSFFGLEIGNRREYATWSEIQQSDSKSPIISDFYIRLCAESSLKEIIKIKIPYFIKGWRLNVQGGIDFKSKEKHVENTPGREFEQFFSYKVGVRTLPIKIPYTPLRFYFFVDRELRETVMIRRMTDWTSFGFRVVW